VVHLTVRCAGIPDIHDAEGRNAAKALGRDSDDGEAPAVQQNRLAERARGRAEDASCQAVAHDRDQRAVRQHILLGSEEPAGGRPDANRREEVRVRVGHARVLSPPAVDGDAVRAFLRPGIGRFSRKRAPVHRRSVASIAALALVAACGGKGSTPTSPTTTPTPAQSSCASWAAQQRGIGVPSAIGGFVAQREALYAAGGGVKAVGSKYYAAYFPSGFASSSTRRVMIALHGTGGAPEAEWNDWKSTLDARGWGFLGLKYLDDATGSYEEEPAIYANIKSMYDEVRAACDFGSASMFVVGFSRGSAQSFGTAYLDAKDRRLITAVGNNSGAWLLNGRPTPTLQPIENTNNLTGMSGTRFWMYCGGQDMEQGFPMCDEMAQAETWVKKYGAPWSGSIATPRARTAASRATRTPFPRCSPTSRA